MASKRKSAKKNLKARHRRARKAFFLCLFLFALLALITRLLVFVPVKMETNAMQPVYQQNDVVLRAVRTYTRILPPRTAAMCAAWSACRAT